MYQPRTDVTDSLKNKTLVMIVGPTAIGKSSLMNEATRLDSEFARVSGFTTREPRPNDEPGLYRYITQSEADKKIANRELVQYAIHPTTGKLYGTEPRDFLSRYNLLDTLYDAVEPALGLPFGQHIIISLTAPSEAWQQWLAQRFPTDSTDRHQRLEEAKQSIEWSQSQTAHHHWLINQPGNLTKTAEQLIELVRRPHRPMVTPAESVSMHTLVQTLL